MSFKDISYLELWRPSCSAKFYRNIVLLLLSHVVSLVRCGTDQYLILFRVRTGLKST